MRFRRRRLVGLGAFLGVVMVLSACAPSGPKPKSDFFGNINGAGYNNWNGDFPDGMVMWDVATAKYYGYSTPTGGRNLPIVSSTDLATWKTRPVYHPADQPFVDPWFNDGMTKPAQWAWEMPAWTGVASRKKIWAPHVAKFGNTYVEFYSVVLSDTDGNPNTIADENFCISYATSAGPLGPFRDDTSGPLVCGDRPPAPFNSEPSNNPNGSIDPSVSFDAAGNAYLLWKNSGAAMPGSNTRIMAQKLNATRTNWAPGFAPGTLIFPYGPRELLATRNNSWMGSPGQIEQPAMIQYQGSWWLFVSGGNTENYTYAIGYARCNGPLGPCGYWPGQAEHAFLSSYNTPFWGPGGGTPFLDAGGGLRLSYHYWANNNPGYEYRPDGTYGMRPMNVALLHWAPNGFVAAL